MQWKLVRGIQIYRFFMMGIALLNPSYACWIMSSEEFINESVQNKSGKNVGKRSIWFNGKRKNKDTGKYAEHCHERFDKYVATNFQRLAKA